MDEPTVFSHIGREVKSKSQNYYQVLIDSRDCPYIRAQTEAVTFLGNQENSRSEEMSPTIYNNCIFIKNPIHYSPVGLYAIPGLDYVSHDDIIPYASTEKNPMNHELFDKFLQYNPEGDPPYWKPRYDNN